MLWMLGLGVLLGAAALLGGAGCFMNRITRPGEETGLIRAVVKAPINEAQTIDVSYLKTPADQTDPNQRPLVYVHGTPGDATKWGHYLYKPIGGRPSLAIDRPGFGSSAGSGVVTSYAEQAAALKAILDTLPQPAILIGHSLGGPIVARTALDNPDQVAALVVAAGGLDPDLEKLRWYNYAVQLPLVSLFLPKAIMRSNDEILASEEQKMVLREDLGQLRVPLVIVHGTKDPLVSYNNVAYMQMMCSDAPMVEVFTLEGANHFIIWQHVDVIEQAIERADDLANETLHH